MRGIFHHHHHHHHHADNDNDNENNAVAAAASTTTTTKPTTTSCVSILHSSPTVATFAEWEDGNANDDDDYHDTTAPYSSTNDLMIATPQSTMPMPMPMKDVIDDTTTLEHSRRVALASSHGFIYDETLGVQSILDALTPNDIQSLSDPQMPLRHYRAEKGNVQEAIRKLKLTLQWRKEFGVENIKRCFDPQQHHHHHHQSGTEDSEIQSSQQLLLNHLATTISHENSTGKIYCRGYDHCGRAILYLTPGRENSTNELDNMRHLVYHLERAIACTARKSGRTKVCIVIGHQGFTLRNAPPMSTVRHTLTILQNHYPERMYRAYICDPPLVFRTFWSIIHHFVDPTTLEKIAFCAGKEGMKFLERDFDTMTTEKQAGGKVKLREFDSKEYLYDTPFEYTFDEKR